MLNWFNSGMGARSVVLLVLVGACYPDADAIRHTVAVVPDGGAEGTTGDDCTGFGVAWCAKAHACGSVQYEITGGDRLCAARLKLWCEDTLTRPADTGWTPAAFHTCIGGWATMSCDDWADSGTEILKGGSCLVPGNRLEGQGCWIFAQCSGLACAGDAACGRCTSRVAVGGACRTDSDCQRGLLCGLGHCAAAVDSGGGCDDAHPCRRSLLCQGGACGPRLAAGQTCNGHDDCGGGLLCNFARSACGPANASSTRCSPDEPDGTVVYCAGGSTCVTATHTCVPFAPDGAACPAQGAPTCLFPAACSAGQCMLPDYEDCPR